jgi:hypothetical protein
VLDIKSFCFNYIHMLLVYCNMMTNVLALGAVADFKSQNCQPARKFD